MYLRQLGENVRFILCRNGQKYRVIGRRLVNTKTEIFVMQEGADKETTLHHSCHVKPIVRTA